MQTLEELNAHYKAVRARIESSKPIVKTPPKVEIRVIEPVIAKEPELQIEDVPVVTMPKNAAQDVVAEVALRHDMTPKDLKGESRQKKYVLARREAAYIMKRDLNMSLTQIGRALGNKDHTSVINMLMKYAIENDVPPLTTCKVKT